MPIKQVTVPYVRGYDFGIGADLASGSPMGKVVDGEITGVVNTSGSAVDFQIQRILSTSDLETALGIDVEASYGCAAFGAGGSARFNFAKKSKVQSSSLFMTITTAVELAFQQIDDPALSSHAAEVVDRPDIFMSRYGNMFVRGIARGGFFVGILRVDTKSSEESETISTELQGSYGLFSATAKQKFESVQRKYRNEVFIRMYHEGGPVDLAINDPTDPLKLLENANLFLQSFQTSPEAVARAYLVTLAPIEIANGPLPLNAAELQKAQDIIVICAKRRSTLLDQINLLDFVNANPSRFDFLHGDADKTAIKNAMQNGEADLNLIAECASSAINSPASAKVPALFAQDKGTTFPKLGMPDPMPKPKAANVVLVPDFMTCNSGSDCENLAVLKGLQLRWEPVPPPATRPLQPFKVLSFIPPKDTPVQEGETITIVFQPEVVSDLETTWSVVTRGR